jgi:hypothetical protein
MNSVSKPLNEKQYKILGRMVVKKHPEIAATLLGTLDHQALEEDISKITSYYDQFCELQGIQRNEYFGAVYKTSKVDIFRLFIASMIHLYYPEIYFQPIEEINMKKEGFVTALAKSIGQHTSHVSNRIREVIMWEQEYDDFKEKVETVVGKLKNAA